MPIIIPMRLFEEMKKIHPKIHFKSQGTLNSQNDHKKELKSFFLIQNLLKSYYEKNSVVLA